LPSVRSGKPRRPREPLHPLQVGGGRIAPVGIDRNAVLGLAELRPMRLGDAVLELGPAGHVLGKDGVPPLTVHSPPTVAVAGIGAERGIDRRIPCRPSISPHSFQPCSLASVARRPGHSRERRFSLAEGTGAPIPYGIVELLLRRFLSISLGLVFRTS
jgi:hypothetical protein